MSYSKLIESFNAYHEIRPALDLRQQLSTMHSKLTNLHERAKLGLPEDEPVESAISQEEVIIQNLKVKKKQKNSGSNWNAEIKNR